MFLFKSILQGGSVFSPKKPTAQQTSNSVRSLGCFLPGMDVPVGFGDRINGEVGSMVVIVISPTYCNALYIGVTKSGSYSYD